MCVLVDVGVWICTVQLGLYTCVYMRVWWCSVSRYCLLWVGKCMHSSYLQTTASCPCHVYMYINTCMHAYIHTYICTYIHNAVVGHEKLPVLYVITSQQACICIHSPVIGTICPWQTHTSLGVNTSGILFPHPTFCVWDLHQADVRM